MRRHFSRSSRLVVPGSLALLLLGSCTDEQALPTGSDLVAPQLAITGGNGTPGGLDAATVRETGQVSLSVDGLGFLSGNVGLIQVQKPAGATVRKAYLATSNAFNTLARNMPPGDTHILQPTGGPTVATSVAHSVVVVNHISSHNGWADVTQHVKSQIDTAPAGVVDVRLWETFPGITEGQILSVIFDDPSVTTDNTILLFFGAMRENGVVDARLNVQFDDPIDLSDPALRIDMSVGISHSNQGFGLDDATYISVNGARMTSCAGGYDDGGAAIGAFITVGGVGNSIANPSDPNCRASYGSFYDDELYNLVPFVQPSATQIQIELGHAEGVLDDNLFFAAFSIAQTPAPTNNAPTANAGGPYSGFEGSPVTYTGAGSSDPDGDALTYAWTFGDGGTATGADPTHVYADNGVYTVGLTVADPSSATGSATATATIANVRPSLPSLAGPNAPVASGAAVTVGGAFTDPGVLDTHTVSYDWGDGTVEPGAVSETNGSGSVSGTHVYAAPGTYVVTVVVTDKDGDSGSATLEIVVEDSNAAPTANGGGPYVRLEGSMVSFDGTASADPDGDALTYTWDFGDGATGVGATPSHTYLDNGVYTVTLVVEDPSGATGSASTTVSVANVAPTLGGLTGPIDPTRVGTPVTVGGNFTDPGVIDTHSVAFDWGDGATSVGSVTGGGGSGGVGAGHVYAAAGVYTVTVTLTDDDGGVHQLGYEFVVVYDPDAGFVTGGGWIDSPAGAYRPDTGLTGRANFGFVSRYKQGASTPSGNTEFQFRAGDLNFKSSAYEFLVITQGGTRAQYKGAGTINGAGAYQFMIWATDGSPDTFRIKIWSESGGVETVVYDNGFDQALGGGSIVIHRK